MGFCPYRCWLPPPRGRRVKIAAMNLNDDRILNAALMEAVDFIQAEGWDRPATLFALVPTELVADALELTEARNPLSLIVQDDLPEHIRPGSEELGEFVASISWPSQVVGAILAQEISFVDSSLGEDAAPQQARLFSGILDAGARDGAAAAGDGSERTLLQLRPTEEELAADPFGQDRVELRGGEDIAPGVIAALRATFVD